MKLRNYQTNAVNAIFDAWQKFKSVLVVLPTGCGKTVVFASVIKRLLSEQLTTVPSPSSATGVGKGDTTATDSSCGVGATEDENSVRAVGMRPRDSVGLPEGKSPSPEGVARGRAAPNRSQFACAEGTCVQKSPRVIVLAHREELVTQARDKITAIVPEADVQVEMADFTVADYFGKKADVVVSTVQTQCAGAEDSRRMTKFTPSEFAAVVIDEAHHATARSYRECIDHYCQNDNCRVLGVTATPDRADETALGNVFDTVAFEYTVTDAIEDGWLVPIRQKLVKVESLDFSGVSTSAGDLNSAELAEVMEDEKNLHGIVAPVLEICKGKRTILFASSVKHAQRISEIINRHSAPGVRPDGIPSEGCRFRADWISGQTPKDKRRDKLEAFKEGKIDILCNVGVLTEGFDDAGVEVVVMARPTKSRALYAQMAGRATRPAADIAAKLGLIENATTATDSSCGVGATGDENSTRAVVAAPNRSQFACAEGTCVQNDAASIRRKMIAESSKPSCLIVDFVGNSGRHKLVTTLDILGGKEIDEDVLSCARAYMREKSDQGEAVDTAEAIAKARKEIEERNIREAKRREFIKASAKFVEIEVDPFNIYDLPPVERLPNDRTRRLSLKQEMLLRTRLRVDPRELGYARSNQFLQEFFRRANSGLASLPQTRLLKRFGIDVPLRSDEAKRIIDRCLAARS